MSMSVSPSGRRPLYSPLEQEEQNPVEIDDSLSVDSTNDLTSEEFMLRLIREETSGAPLILLYGICLTMAVISVFLATELEESLRLAFSQEEIESGSDTVVWFSVLAGQLPIVKNLFHCSLLGAISTVAAMRGDFVWLFTIRNTSFFFGLVAVSFFLVDLQAVISFNGEPSHRLFFSSLMTFFCFASFIYLSRTQKRVLGMVLNQEAEGPGFPDSEFDLSRVRCIRISAILVQAAAVSYTMYTTGNQLLNSKYATSNPSLGAFESAYAAAAHHSFLLALLHLVISLPRDPSVIGGGLLTSAWRSIVALASLGRIMFASEAEVDLDNNKDYSIAFTAVEAIVMLPTFCIAISLAKDYFPLVGSDADCQSISRTTTMHSIARCQDHSPRHRLGAALVFSGSLLLFVGMTAECVLMLRMASEHMIVIQDVVVWGMHVSSMLLFVTVMSVSSPTTYGYARLLLLGMCPVGSLVALWQFSMVQRFSVSVQDTSTVLTLILLLFRAFCGMVQFSGLVLLTAIRVDDRSTWVYEEGQNNQQDDSKEHELIRELKKTRNLLYKVYIPSLLAYLISTVCSDRFMPMISRMRLSADTVAGNDSFSLVQWWPGLGLLFHFGIVVVIFVFDSVSSTAPTYLPSQLISALFLVNAAMLESAYIVWEFTMDMETAIYSWKSKVPCAFFAGSATLLSFRLWKLRKVRES